MNLTNVAVKGSLWATKKSAKLVVDLSAKAINIIFANRKKIIKGISLTGTALGAALGSVAELTADSLSIKIYSNEKIRKLYKKIQKQAKKYKDLTSQLNYRNIDAIAVGGDLLINILNHPRKISHEIIQAFEKAYPQESLKYSFSEKVQSLSNDELPGFISGIKGKLFEIKYVDYLNDKNLPEGFTAQLATSPTQSGWDIKIIDPDGEIADQMQAKATDSIGYVKRALEEYPEIDIVTTDEVYSQLVLIGAAEEVTKSGIDNSDLIEVLKDATEDGNFLFDWSPPILTMALIAFTSFMKKDVSEYQKARIGGKRAGKAYLSYLFGKGICAVTNVWWLGLLAGIGSRLLASHGRKNRNLFHELKKVYKYNNKVLKRISENINKQELK
jgi:hypothetical protein